MEKFTWKASPVQSLVRELFANLSLDFSRFVAQNADARADRPASMVTTEPLV
jgi:hypothetical protein